MNAPAQGERETRKGELDRAIRWSGFVIPFIAFLLVTYAVRNAHPRFGPLMLTCYSFMLPVAFATIVRALVERRQGFAAPQTAGPGDRMLPGAVIVLFAALVYGVSSAVESFTAPWLLAAGIFVSAAVIGAALGAASRAFAPRRQGTP